MTEQDLVFAHCRERQAQGREIDHGVARTIGAWWHVGYNATITFTSTGTVAEDLTPYTFHEGAYEMESADDRLALDMLGTYLLRRRVAGQTGPVPGWADMWADKLSGRTPGEREWAATHYGETLPACDGDVLEQDTVTEDLANVRCLNCLETVHAAV
jgi:hypothetical protein